MVIKANLPRYPDPSRVDGGRSPQSATLREAGKSFDFYDYIIPIFILNLKPVIRNLQLETETL
jgi:hypothetical protein